MNVLNSLTQAGLLQVEASPQARKGPRRIILLAEDDPDDYQLTRDALFECELGTELHCVEDGEHLLNYLRRRGPFDVLAGQPLPGLILLDLNMPRMDGREALREIKADPELRRVPIVVLTTSKADEDILRTYDFGVNSYITKPVTFDKLVSTIRVLAQYWFETVQLPPREDRV